MDKFIDKYLYERKKKLTLKQNERKKANRRLTKMDNYHIQIPIQDIQNILNQFGMIMLQEDYTEWSGMLLGERGQEYFDVGSIDTYDGRFYEPYDNTSLALSGYTMPSGKYEIVVYLT